MTTLDQTEHPADAGPDRAPLRADAARSAASRLRRFETRGLPPGPRWPVWLQSVGAAALPAPVRARACSAGTATSSPSGSCPAGRPLVLFTRPEHAKEIFAGDPEVFHAGKGNAILGPIMGEHSLLLQDGAEHKRARKLLMPAFNGHALRGYRGAGRPRLARERGRRAGAPGEEFRSLDRMNALTLEVILRVVFGVTDESRLAAAAAAGQPDRRHQPGGAARLGLPVRCSGSGPGSATVENASRARRADLRRDPRAPRRPRPRRAHRRALPADPGRRRTATGSPTTSCATSWSRCCSPGTRPPRPRWPGRSTSSAATRAQLRPGPRGRAAPATTTYLEAVLKESMRLHPVIPMVVRHPDAAGHARRLATCPPGATVGPSILIAHARDDNHPDPERVPTRRGSSGRTRRSTPGSRSAAASGAASGPGSR